MALDPRDPSAQGIEHDLFVEGLGDPSRAEAVLKILPRLVGALPELRPVQTTSGMPQTGMEGLADVNALAGQAPSGIGTDVKTGVQLGDIYANRAQLRQRGDIAANELELRRTGQLNEMARAQSAQDLGLLDWEQKDRQLAHSIAVNKRLLATDARMRLTFLADAGKTYGELDAPARRAYDTHVDNALRDPVRRKAFENPQTGFDTMVTILDEANATARRSSGQPAATPGPVTNVGPPNRPVPMPTGPVAPPVTGLVGPADFPRVSPQEQAGRDDKRREILEGELANEMAQQPSPERDRNIGLLQAELGNTQGGTATAPRAATTAPFTFRDQLPTESGPKYAAEREVARTKWVDDQRQAEQLKLNQEREQRERKHQESEQTRHYTNIAVGEQAKQDLSLSQSASQATRSAEDANAILKILTESRPITGAGAEFKTNVLRILDSANIPNSEKTRIADTQELASRLARSVYTAYSALGLTAQQMNTPAEAKMLADAMAGTLTLDAETLKRLATITYKAQADLAARWNKRVPELPKEFFATTGRKRENEQVTLPPLYVPPAQSAPTGPAEIPPEIRRLWQR